jgi:thiamine pyrophosphate-dependent acetolactate synthase large subunit-like protein
MNAMPPPPSPDLGGWFSFAEHLEAVIGVAFGAVMTAAAGLWRAATWTAQIKEDREASERRHTAALAASDERHKSILDKLDDMQESNAQQHESAWREMDQMRQDIRADREETRAMRQETREAAATLSARIDFVMGDRRH